MRTVCPNCFKELSAEASNTGGAGVADVDCVVCDRCGHSFDPNDVPTGVMIQHTVPADLDAGSPLRAAGASQVEIPGYTILKEIHRGGQGVVYQALHHATRRKVALKVMLEGPLADESTKRRFEREIELVSSLDHPNIVRVYDSGMTTGHYYFSMEYISGQPLDQYVKSRALSLQAILELFAEVCNGVAYAHRRGIIHRDLKPSNVRVDDQGRPHVLDFGLARTESADVIGGRQRMMLVSVTGQFIGTLPYMSPEQTLGRAGAVDIRSDVYSLGVILYQMLTGQFPYDVTCQITEVLKNITETMPARPVVQGKRLNHEAETIVLKALAKEPERRYQSAGELERDIRHYLAGEPIEAKRESTVYLLRKTLQRHRGAAFATSLILVLILAFAVGMSVLYARAESARSAAVDEREKARDALRIAQDNMRFFVQEVDRDIAPLAGSTPVREALLRKALNHYLRFVEQARQDVGLRRELAAAYESMAIVARTLGDSAEAHSLLKEALSIRREYHESDVADPAGARELARTYVLSADLESLIADSEAALRSYRAGLEWLDRPGVIRDDDFETQALLGTALSRSGEVLISLGRLDEAWETCRRAADIQRSLLRIAADRREARLDLAASYYRLHGLAQRLPEQAGEAREYHDRAHAIFEDLYRAHPTDARIRRWYAVSLNQRGQYEADAGRFDEARRYFEQSLALHRALSEADPVNATALRDVAVMHLKLGELFFATEEDDEAKTHFDHFLRIAQDLAAREPDSTLRKSDLAAAYAKQVDLACEQGRHDDALAFFEPMKRLLTELAEEAPDDADRLDSLSYAYYTLADIHRAKGDFSRALESCERAVEIARRLSERQPRDRVRQVNLIVGCETQGDLALEAQETPLAREAFERAREVLTRLCELYPADAEIRELKTRIEGKLTDLDPPE